MHSKIFAISALATFAAAAPHLNAREYAENSTSSGIAAMSTGGASSTSGSDPNADAGGQTFQIPSAISVDPAVRTTAADEAKALAKVVNGEVTSVQRFNQVLTEGGEGKVLLSGDDLQKAVVFDFNKAPDTGKGGRFQLANVNAFPILSHQGIATAVGFLKPCSMNSPHTHPRATEWLTVVQGELRSGYILENGFVDPDNTPEGNGPALASEVQFNLTAFQGTVFPQGSIHYQFNDQCEPATFIATLNSEDPGTSQATQNLFFLDPEVVDGALGGDVDINGHDISMFRGALPLNLVNTMAQCRQRCGYDSE